MVSLWRSTDGAIAPVTASEVRVMLFFIFRLKTAPLIIDAETVMKHRRSVAARCHRYVTIANAVCP